MKICTDLEQSKKLAEILPIESADMMWDDWSLIDEGWKLSVGYYPEIEKDYGRKCYPAWSLAALTNVMRLDYYIVRTLDILTHKFTYSIHAGYFDIETDEYDELIDACVEMIYELKEKDLLK